jgi:tRNA threonylcarbamoyladenosine biosynthesis protein TsaB
LRPKWLADPLLLAFDTSAAHCAAALVSGPAILAERHEPMERGQAERLLPLLDEVLAEAGLAWGDLAGIGVGTGPGNFTGVRIAVAAARGLALGLGVPALGVSTFEALAWGRPDVLAAVDARLHGEVHVQGFGRAAFGPLTLAADEARPPLPEGTVVVGHDAPALARRLGGAAGEPLLPLAAAMGRVALSRLGSPAPRPAPLYLRAPDAAPPREAPPVLLPG